MSNEELRYTEGEMKLLIATSEVKTMQKMMLESFTGHVNDDEDHFDRLYEADKKILEKIDSIPEKLAKSTEKIKNDILLVADERYTPIIDFKVFKTQITTSIVIGTVIGSLIATIASLIISAYKLKGG